MSHECNKSRDIQPPFDEAVVLEYLGGKETVEENEKTDRWKNREISNR